ncbi:MAG: GNAT family N-acetyltransferase [Paracoccaceae bacterium]
MPDTNVDFHKARPGGDADRIARLARVIWVDHYTPIIGADQVDYMLATLHSPDAIAREIASGAFNYYIVSDGEADLGYLSYKLEDKELFLSKIYLLPSARGRGLGKAALAFLRSRATEKGLRSIRLTVNKMNSGTIRAYEAIGFTTTRAVKADIGNGYFMDDFIMEWRF